MSKKFNKYNYGLCLGQHFQFTDKERAINTHISYMLNRTLSMFKYKGLPDTIPFRSLELYLQLNGNCCFYEVDGDLYVFTGGLGGEPDPYYMPTIYTIANPALKISKSLEIDKECVVVTNDYLYMGLLPLFEKYATALTENELSMNIAAINSRIIALISASDDRTAKSAKEFLKDIEAGKLGVIGENALLDGVKSQPLTTKGAGTITDLIEHEQYLKASWFNEMGLNANYNMKREAINSNESQLNNDMLLPFIDTMLECRKKGLEKVNKMFGTNITVELASSWEDNQIELDLIQKNLKEDPEEIEEPEEVEETPEEVEENPEEGE